MNTTPARDFYCLCSSLTLISAFSASTFADESPVLQLCVRKSLDPLPRRGEVWSNCDRSTSFGVDKVEVLRGEIPLVRLDIARKDHERVSRLMAENQGTAIVLVRRRVLQVVYLYESTPGPIDVPFDSDEMEVIELLENQSLP